MNHAEEITDDDWLEVVRRKVAGIRFGSVQIIVHDGRVTQVESLEKTRFATGRDGVSAAPKVRSSAKV